jgi:hypothetical protein
MVRPAHTGPAGHVVNGMPYSALVHEHQGGERPAVIEIREL